MEVVMREAGSCGRFQVCHVIFTQLPRFVIVWAVFLMMFGSYDPGWRCRGAGGAYGANGGGAGGAGGGAGGAEDAFNVNLSSTIIPDSTTSINNYLYSNDSSSEGNSNETAYDGKCSEIQFCDDVEFDPASVTVVTKFRLICDRAWIVRCIFLLQGVGFFIGALLGGQIGEWLGRRIALYSSCFLVCLSSGLAIFSPHWVMYGICAFFVGVGSNGVISLSSVFSMEFLNSKWRGYFGSFPTWNVSLFLFTASFAAMKSWVYLHLLTCSMALLASLGFFVVAESPRWLLMNNRPEKAQKAIKKIARINRKTAPTLETLLQIQAEERGDNPEGARKSYTYLDLFRNYEARITALKLSTVMGIFGVSYYALGFGIKSLPGDFYVNGIASSVCEIVNLLLTGPLCNYIGRRGAGVIMATIGTASCSAIVIAIFAAEGSTQALVIKIFAFEAKSASHAIFSIAQLFIVELFPTVVRNVAIGFCRCAAGLGSLIAPFLIPSAADGVSFAICFSVLCVSYVIVLLIFVILPETNKKDLLDSIKPADTKIALVEDAENESPTKS